jgi:hypothetical protein
MAVGGLFMAACGWASADPTAPGATPDTKPATTVAPAVAQAPKEDKVVCKTEIPTGSRLGGHSVCMKKSEWEAQAQAAQRQRVFAPPAGISGVK